MIGMKSIYLLMASLWTILHPGVAEEVWSKVDSNEIDTIDHRQLQGSFRLKMFWQKGYFWQESAKEKKWCLTCRNGCKSGSNVQIR
jgi:hypothetical protein